MGIIRYILRKRITQYVHIRRCCVRMQFKFKLKSFVTFNYAAQIEVGLRNRRFNRIRTTRAPRSPHLHPRTVIDTNSDFLVVLHTHNTPED